MTTESESDSDLYERVENFLRRNFPQIQMHGGTTAIQELDPETGEVTLYLGGACSGCGISDMTVQAIKSRMTQEIPEITTVNASTGMESMEGFPDSGGVGTASRGQSRKPDDPSNAPF